MSTLTSQTSLQLTESPFMVSDELAAELSGKGPVIQVVYNRHSSSLLAVKCASLECLAPIAYPIDSSTAWSVARDYLDKTFKSDISLSLAEFALRLKMLDAPEGAKEEIAKHVKRAVAKLRRKIDAIRTDYQVKGQPDLFDEEAPEPKRVQLDVFYTSDSCLVGISKLAAEAGLKVSTSAVTSKPSLRGYISSPDEVAKIYLDKVGNKINTVGTEEQHEKFLRLISKCRAQGRGFDVGESLVESPFLVSHGERDKRRSLSDGETVLTFLSFGYNELKSTTFVLIEMFPTVVYYRSVSNFHDDAKREITIESSTEEFRQKTGLDCHRSESMDYHEVARGLRRGGYDREAELVLKYGDELTRLSDEIQSQVVYVDSPAESVKLTLNKKPDTQKIIASLAHNSGVMLDSQSLFDKERTRMLDAVDGARVTYKIFRTDDSHYPWLEFTAVGTRDQLETFNRKLNKLAAAASIGESLVESPFLASEEDTDEYKYYKQKYGDLFAAIAEHGADTIDVYIYASSCMLPSVCAFLDRSPAIPIGVSLDRITRALGIVDNNPIYYEVSLDSLVSSLLEMNMPEAAAKLTQQAQQVRQNLADIGADDIVSFNPEDYERKIDFSSYPKKSDIAKAANASGVILAATEIKGINMLTATVHSIRRRYKLMNPISMSAYTTFVAIGDTDQLAAFERRLAKLSTVGSTKESLELIESPFLVHSHERESRRARYGDASVVAFLTSGRNSLAEPLVQIDVVRTVTYYQSVRNFYGDDGYRSVTIYVPQEKFSRKTGLQLNDGLGGPFDPETVIDGLTRGGYTEEAEQLRALVQALSTEAAEIESQVVYADKGRGATRVTLASSPDTAKKITALAHSSDVALYSSDPHTAQDDDLYNVEGVKAKYLIVRPRGYSPWLKFTAVGTRDQLEAFDRKLTKLAAAASIGESLVESPIVSSLSTAQNGELHRHHAIFWFVKQGENFAIKFKLNDLSVPDRLGEPAVTVSVPVEFARSINPYTGQHSYGAAQRSGISSSPMTYDEFEARALDLPQHDKLIRKILTKVDQLVDRANDRRKRLYTAPDEHRIQLGGHFNVNVRHMVDTADDLGMVVMKYDGSMSHYAAMVLGRAANPGDKIAEYTSGIGRGASIFAVGTDEQHAALVRKLSKLAMK